MKLRTILMVAMTILTIAGSISAADAKPRRVALFCDNGVCCAVYLLDNGDTVVSCGPDVII